MYKLLRNILFTLPAETSHCLGLGSLDLLHKINLLNASPVKINTPPLEIMGISFPNPVGLAAGLDKDGEHITALNALGFGFIEIGTVTPRPQAGNPRPRLFRLVDSRGIINRMGFNNKGVDHLVEQVKKSRFDGVLGINIGKNKETSTEKAADDYLYCMRKVYPLASYIVINLSSPNTPGLRDLQFGKPLEKLLSTLKAEQKILSDKHKKYVPLVIKIAPDLEENEIVRIASCLKQHDVDGVIATNTTIDRELVSQSRYAHEQGGLSGAPLTAKSTEVIRILAGALNGALPIIGVGGIMSAQDAADKLTAGASLVQIYSGLIYRGPKLISSICAMSMEKVNIKQ